jgi:PKD repeat protein
MARSIRTLAAAVILAAIGAAGCTVNKADKAPDLSGPSETGTSLALSVTPDVIFQDGASQSLVTITAFGPSGQPLRNVSLRAEIVVGGASTDFGSLSARNLVTDTNGRSTVTYTAPAPPVFNVDAGTVVQISVTPLGSDFSNANPRMVSIRLVPPGIIGPPVSPLKPDFVAPSATIGNSAVFQATVVDATGADATADVVSYLWNFGDGSTATGRTANHTFDDPGSFGVSLTITDTLGRSNRTTRTVTVGQGQVPTASFLASPTAPNVGQTVNFNASGSSAEPGHQIADYSWNFGDGSTGSGQLTTHAYSQAGSYTVTLKVTDDVGRVSAVATQTIAAGTGGPTASFTTSPSSPITNQTINFNASQSRAVPGRTIVSYAWDFGDGTTGSGVQTTHAFTAVGTYVVTLTITDNAGQTAFANQSISVATDTPRASFVITPSAPTAPTGTNASVVFDGSASTAATGRTLVSFAWRDSLGRTSTGQVVSGFFGAPGTYSMTLTVTDNVGRTNTVTQVFTVSGT